MEKSIYDLLNEVKMDEREYEENELSYQEKDRKKQEILKEHSCNSEITPIE